MEATKSRSRSFLIAALAAIMAVIAALAVALPQHAYADDTSLTAGTLQTQASATDGKTWNRLAGPEALDTMTAIVNEGWKTSDVAVLTTFDGYWDALAAASVAGQVKAPVLMTKGDALSAQTAKVLGKLKPSKIIVVGGPAAISDSVANAAKAATGTTTKIERLWGLDAIGTANDVFASGAKVTGGKWNANGSAFVATNDGYWDALAAAPVSYASGTPIFLADGHSSLTADTIKTMKAGGIKNVYIVGGEVAIEPAVEKQLKDNGISVTARLGGETAIETSVEVAKCGILDFNMTPKNTGIATRNGYWDALTGAALCGLNNSPIVLADDVNSNSVTKFVKPIAAGIEEGYIFGGKAALPETLDPALEKISAAADKGGSDEPSGDEPSGDESSIDKSALEQAIAKASAIEQGSKSDEAKAALDKAIAAAQAVADNDNATQNEVDAAVKALNEAVEEFENSPDVPDTVAVTFSVPEGCGVAAPDAQTIEKGVMIRDSATFSLPSLTDAEGNVAAWYSDEALTEAVGPKSSFDADVTLYAKFSPFLTVNVVVGDKTYSRNISEDAFKDLLSESTDPVSMLYNVSIADGTYGIATAGQYAPLKGLFEAVAGDGITKDEIDAAWASEGASVNYAAADLDADRTVADLEAGLFYGELAADAAGTPVVPSLAYTSDGNKSLVAADLTPAAAQAQFAASANASAGLRIVYGPTADEWAAGKVATGKKAISGVRTLTLTAQQ